MPRYDVTGVDLDLRLFPWAGSYFNVGSKHTYIFFIFFLSCSWLCKRISSSPHYRLFNQLVTFAKIVRGGVGN